MGFKSREENGGEIDKKINTAGRPKGSGKKLNRREIYDKEMLALARKVKPHWSKALMEIVKLINKEGTTDQVKLKAAVVVDGMYRSILKEVYDVDSVTEVEEVQPQQTGAVFSLKMINTEEKTGTED